MKKFLLSFLLAITFIIPAFAEVQIQLRRDTEANWTSANPVLASGEVGVETVTKQFKIGDGTSHWTTLSYVSGGSMTYPGAGIPLSTGTAWGTSITNNSGNWNTAYGWGNHASAGYVTGTPWTSMGYLTAVASDSTWTTHNSYPSACSTGQYVSAIGDTLTCATPTDTGITSLTTSTPTNLTGFIKGNGSVLSADNSTYLTSVASDSTWTVHGSYPAACSAGQYVSAIGDTLTCGTPTDTNTTYTATANRGLLLTSSTQFGLIETCNSGELLKWNGSAWACATDTTGAASGTPGGSSTQIQYNAAGALGGVDGFIYNGTALSYTGNIGLGSTVPTQKLDVNGTVKATAFIGDGAGLSGIDYGNIDGGDSDLEIAILSVDGGDSTSF